MKRVICFFLLFLDLSLNCYAQMVYTSNTGRGLMTKNDQYIKSLTIREDSHSTTQFLYAYLNAVMTDDCIRDDGMIDEDNLYITLKKYFDRVLDFDGNIRYIIRAFPTCCSSWEGFSPKLVEDKYTNDGKMLIWYPEKLHQLLMDSNNPTISYWKNIDAFKKTKNLSIIDLRSELVYNVYDKVLKCFSNYLNESVNRKDINGNFLKKGDFILCIEMGYVGPFGEGRTDFYGMYESSEPLIRIAELYKKYLSDYILVAPGFGMRTDITTNPNLLLFQHYLLTTTYGEGKEFGLFIDHLGHYNYKLDFTLNMSDIYNIRELACNKYKNAPFIGENSGNFQDESKRIFECVNEFHISMCEPWGDLIIDKEAVRKWRRASEIMGYVFSLNNDSVSWYKRKISVSFEIENEGVAYYYWDFWKPELVVKDRNSKEIISVIDISKELVLSSNIFPQRVDIKKKAIPFFLYLGHKKNDYDVFLRVIDEKGISDNMEFADGNSLLLLGSR